MLPEHLCTSQDVHRWLPEHPSEFSNGGLGKGRHGRTSMEKPHGRWDLGNQRSTSLGKPIGRKTSDHQVQSVFEPTAAVVVALRWESRTVDGTSETNAAYHLENRSFVKPRTTNCNQSLSPCNRHGRTSMKKPHGRWGLGNQRNISLGKTDRS